MLNVLNVIYLLFPLFLRHLMKGLFSKQFKESKKKSMINKLKNYQYKLMSISYESSRNLSQLEQIVHKEVLELFFIENNLNVTYAWNL